MIDEKTMGHIEDACSGVSDLTSIIHGLNVQAGWWNNLKTGQAYRCVGHNNTASDDPQILERNAGEMIALMHSELSEALEGVRKGLMDDKLPHRKMEEVEMADTIIRILDYCGGRGLDVGGALKEKLAFNATREDHKIETRKREGGKTI